MIATFLLGFALFNTAVAPQDAKIASFKEAFAHRRGDYPNTVPDTAIQRCMAILAYETKSRLTAQTADDFAVPEVLLPFLKAVGEKSYPATSYYIADLHLADMELQKAISVTMGAVSRIFYWRGGNSVPVSSSLSWFHGFELRPYFADCGAMVVNAVSVNDAGMRYDTKALVVSTDGDRLEIVGVANGQWLLEEEDAPSPFVLDEDTLELTSLDEPKSFFVSSSTKAFVRRSAYAISQKGLRRTSVSLDMPGTRAVDAWIRTAQSAKSPDALQRRFLRTAGKERGMALELSESKAADGIKVNLNLEGNKYQFRVRKQGARLSVVGFSHKGA